MHGQTYADDRGIWQVTALWDAAKGLPVEVVPRCTLEPQLDSYCWAPNSEEPLTAREILDHTIRILNADMTYPILISQFGWVMDGMHRLAKAVLMDYPYISIQRFTTDPPPTTTRS